MSDVKKLENLVRLEELVRLAKTVRYWILRMSTKAGSGHPTSSLSATDLMVALFFEKLRYDLENPDNSANDRVIFSKGHASPLFYALYKVASVISETEADTYRQFESRLEGHPTPKFKYAEAATGSLGQGLSIGVGEALAIKSKAKNQKLKVKDTPKVYVLLGDSEMAEGSVWEAIQIASEYKLDNLVGIIDVNRLGQRGETMLGHDVETYKRRVEAFGWDVQVIDGHNFGEILSAFGLVLGKSGKPYMIVAKTLKGKGVSFLEDKDGWHGKALPQEEFEKATWELGKVDKELTAKIAKPTGENKSQKFPLRHPRLKLPYKIGDEVATRKAYGESLAELGKVNIEVVALDGEVSNSTYSEIFKKAHPERFFEMYIAEQNMVGTALGLSKRGKIPFVSTFAAFFTRAFDQIRMSAISRGNIKFVGSHSGVSIGEDGPSQMGLEDFAMFRAVYGSRVFCPADANAVASIVKIAAENEGIFYIRTNRPDTPVLYSQDEKFEIGGSKVLRSTSSDKITIVSCGVTLFEALKAASKLKKEGINVRVIDAYSIKPIDREGILKSAKETQRKLLVCEDHYFEGGLGEAVSSALSEEAEIVLYRLAVGKMPVSGKFSELYDFEEISVKSIVSKVKEVLKKPYFLKKV